MRKLDEFIGVIHKHSYAGFKRLDQSCYESTGFRLSASYDGYCHNVNVISFLVGLISEEAKDRVIEFIINFENNKMRFE